MFDLYRYNCRLNFIDIEIDANEFSFKKNNNKNDVERMNKNKNIFKLFEIDVVF